MRTKLIGDGCSICNPSLALEHATEYIEELESTISRALKDLKIDGHTKRGVYNAIATLEDNA